MRGRAALVCLGVAAVAACGSNGASAPATAPQNTAAEPTSGANTTPLPGHYSETYSEPDHWLCLPGAEGDICGAPSLTTTVVAPRTGELRTETVAAASDPSVDCFYLYPTVDRSASGNRELGGDRAAEAAWARAEAAWFSEVCRVFAPLYRQANGASETEPEAVETAYSDVVDAFEHYLDQLSAGRPFVMIGHGQGADMAARLLREEVDGNPQRQARLVSALLPGASTIRVPEGASAGSTLPTIPLCTSREQTGCAVAYNTYEAGSVPPLDNLLFANRPEGTRVACTNPAGLDGSRGQLRAARFPSDPGQGPWVGGLPQVESAYVTYPEYFLGECVNYGSGVWYLRLERTIDPLDTRMLGPLADPGNEAIGLGLHHLDVVVALGDLVALVQEQAAELG